MEAHKFIEGYESVVDHLGLWPSFHDAEVLKLVIDRTSPCHSSVPSPALDLHLRGWVMTSELTATGFYKLQGEAVFHFRFEGISRLRIEGFNNQNVLSSLNLELVTHPRDASRQMLQVELEHCYEFEASFTAERAFVLGIKPCRQ